MNRREESPFGGPDVWVAPTSTTVEVSVESKTGLEANPFGAPDAWIAPAVTAQAGSTQQEQVPPAQERQVIEPGMEGYDVPKFDASIKTDKFEKERLPQLRKEIKEWKFGLKNLLNTYAQEDEQFGKLSREKQEQLVIDAMNGRDRSDQISHPQAFAEFIASRGEVIVKFQAEIDEREQEIARIDGTTKKTEVVTEEPEAVVPEAPKPTVEFLTAQREEHLSKLNAAIAEYANTDRVFGKFPLERQRKIISDHAQGKTSFNDLNRFSQNPDRLGNWLRSVAYPLEDKVRSNNEVLAELQKEMGVETAVEVQVTSEEPVAEMIVQEGAPQPTVESLTASRDATAKKLDTALEEYAKTDFVFAGLSKEERRKVVVEHQSGEKTYSDLSAVSENPDGLGNWLRLEAYPLEDDILESDAGILELEKALKKPQKAEEKTAKRSGFGKWLRGLFSREEN